MRISIVLGHAFPVPPIKGGAIESRAWELAEEFSRKGHDVVIYSVQSEGLAREECYGERLLVRRLPSGAWVKSRILNFIRSLVWSWRIGSIFSLDADVIVSKTLFFPYLRRIRKSSAPVFVGLHREPRWGYCRFVSILGKFPRVGKLKFIAVSDFVAEKFLKYVPDCFGDVSSISNPVDVRTFCPRIGCVRESGRILYAGRVARDKGLDVLLLAIRELLDRGIEVSLRIAGGLTEQDGSDPVLVEELKAYVENSGMTSVVEFLGYMGRERLVEEYRGASVFVYPSTGGEAWSNSPAEAMACGCPVVTSDFGSFPQMFSHGVEGFQARTGDSHSLASCLERVLLDDGLRQAMSVSATRRAENFSLGKTAGLYLQTFTSAS